MEGITLRDTTAADEATVLALTLDAYAPYAPIIGDEWWTGYRQSLLATLAHDSRAHGIVAEYAGQVVGSVLLYPGNSQATGLPQVRYLAVAPSARGKGIGTVLMEECLRRVRLAGATTIQLHTMEAMHTARRLYQRMGFVRAPDQDFSPVSGVVVQGYRLSLLDAGAL